MSRIVKTKYVVKTAYSTNRDNLKFAENEDDVISKKVLIYTIYAIVYTIYI